MDYSTGRLIYLVLLALLLLFFLRGHRLGLGQGVRILAIWGTIIAALALAYTLVAG